MGGPRKHAIRRHATTGRLDQHPEQRATTEQSGTVMIGLRVPVELRKWLEERAAANHRNLSQECERTLERSFSPEALFVDTVAAMEGPEAHQKIAEYLHAMAADVYGLAATNAGLAMMRQLSAWEMYGKHFVPNQTDIDTCRTAIAALSEAIRQSEASREQRPQATLPVSAKQVRDAMASRIAMGEWKPNTAIPKESDLAREFGVSPETVREALDFMEAEGLVKTVKARKATRPNLFVVTSQTAA
jgi:hypothetical protein